MLGGYNQAGSERWVQEHKEAAVLKKLQPPYNRTVAQLAEEEGISTGTLYSWRRKARAEGCLLPDSSPDPEGWSARDKFNAVLETAALSETEVAEYCRQRGLYPEQIQRWRASCEQANDLSDEAARRETGRPYGPNASERRRWRRSCNARRQRWPRPRPC